MAKIIKSICIGLIVMMGLNHAFASDTKGSPEEAIAMVKKAAAFLKANGKEKAFAEFANAGNKQFHDRDLYIFVYDMSGVAVAHGNNPKMVGKNLIEMADSDGKYIIKSFIDVANTKGKGWIDYKWPNPVTKTVEQKSSYIEKVDGDLIIGAGIYK